MGESLAHEAGHEQGASEDGLRGAPGEVTVGPRR